MATNDLDQLRHARSAKIYPTLDLEDGEYVVLEIVRAKIVYILTWLVVILALIGLSSLLFFLSGDAMVGSMEILDFNAKTKYYFVMTFLVLYMSAIVLGLIASSVHRENRLYISNKRVIQNLRPNIFSNSTNIIDLRRIEDVSFRQNGLIQQLLGIGTIRMATVGDETTYTFRLTNSSREEMKTISHLIRKAKASDTKSDN